MKTQSKYFPAVYLLFFVLGFSCILAAEKMKIDPGGNVGIGISSPLEKLHVAGSALISGNITIQDALMLKQKAQAPTAPAVGTLHHNVSGNLYLYTGTGWREFLLDTNIEDLAPANVAPIAQAGADLVTTVGGNVSLLGSASDDGLPQNTLTYNWTKHSGSGNATFGSASSASTTVIFSSSGNYMLRLSVSDGALTGTDDINVQVNVAAPVNVAPTAQAGADLVTTVGGSVNLLGSASDDGLPSNTLTYSWTKHSGPGIATFGNASSASTTVSFNTSGSYTLRLSVSDSALVGTDDINVQVNVAAPVNVAPTAQAGADLVTTVGGSVGLLGSASDDGLPSNTLTYSWSKLSGPGIATFGNASSASTTVSFNTSGSYTLRLSVSDGALTGTDDINVTVNAAEGGGSNLVKATGGTITTSGGYIIHTFLSNSTFTVTAGGEVEYLIVGGGGGGGQAGNGGGGGGAGGFRTGTTTASVQGYTITVGAGGAADTNGSPSSAFGIESAGGGRGATTTQTGGTGGSGGGGSIDGTNLGAAGNTPSTSPVQGYAGGTSSGGGWNGGSGGGGASAVGANGGGDGNASGVIAGDGGAGRVSSISGSSVTYAGGGGGHNTGNADAVKKGDGGAGGGGTGGTDLGGTKNTNATNGTANTGGGGGGGRQNSSNGPTVAGSGGSGIVIIRYLAPPVVATGGTITTSGGYKIHTFNSSDTFTVTSGGTVEYLVVAGGGGGGGGQQGGGGGAGGYLSSTSHTVTAQAYTITVGAGGSGCIPGAAASNGSNSVFDTATAIGGGRGASELPDAKANLGGSGGGGSWKDPTYLFGNVGTAGQGTAGGNGFAIDGNNIGGGGGGGSSGVGTPGTAGVMQPAGGPGTSNSISGSSVTYAIGGNGANRDRQTNGANASANTGNGGNAGGADAGNSTGGNGGSGIVIIRYLSP